MRCALGVVTLLTSAAFGASAVTLSGHDVQGLDGIQIQNSGGDAIVRYRNGWGADSDTGHGKANTAVYQIVTKSNSGVQTKGLANVGIVHATNTGDPSTAMASVADTKTIACELEQTGSISYAVNCFVLTSSADGSQLTAGGKNVLVSGNYGEPGFPETIHLAKVDNGKAVACYHLERWIQNRRLSSLRGNDGRRLDTRDDTAECRVVTLNGETGLSFGQATQMVSTGADSLTLTSLETNKALACYGQVSDNGNKNKCTVVQVAGDSVSYGNHLIFDDRVGTYTGDACKASRLGEGTAAICCETASWSGWTRYVECKAAKYSGTTLSLESHWWGDSVSVVDVTWPGSLVPNAMAHISDSNGGTALICHDKKQEVFACHKLAVEDSWWWGKYLTKEQKFNSEPTAYDHTHSGSSWMGLAKLTSSDVALCGRLKNGQGDCKVISVS